MLIKGYGRRLLRNHVSVSCRPERRPNKPTKLLKMRPLQMGLGLRPSLKTQHACKHLLSLTVFDTTCLFVMSNSLQMKSTCICCQQILGYWHQRADERHGNPPQCNQELLVVRDKVGKPQVSLG